MIKSPYNFVPLSKKVVMPYWAKYISHDVPFKGAQSGVLTLKMKAESPIYVRNGVPRDTDREHDPEYIRFNHMDGKYFIPGSSIKGMFRSVMEIMSFGRMHNKVNDHKYSVRDFQNDDIYPKTDLSNKVECGWLYKKGDAYYIDKCGKPGRISHKNLDPLCSTIKISEYYKRRENVRTDKDKSAYEKNRRFSFEKEGHRFEEDYGDELTGKVYKLSGSGNPGTIVLTGQSSSRNEPKHGKSSGKYLEFIFWSVKEEAVEVPQEVVDNFLFAYYDHDRSQQKEDWKWWRKKELEAGKKIPVFYRTKKTGRNETEFIDMGLTMLYKITYKNSVVDLINKQQKEADDYDLAEAIFGYTEIDKALKGRVHVGHAFAEGQVEPLEVKKEVLAGPKASYYPNYIEQDITEGAEGKIKGKYNTFMNETARIRGWKRYPVQNNGTVSYPLPKRRDGSINYDVVTKFQPLPAGTEFSFDIAYHNLKKEELGALISAITFHNTDGLYHVIGTAKPLGYGKVALSLEGISENEKMDMLKSYEAFMEYELGANGKDWIHSPQLTELFAMANPGEADEDLSYMKLEEYASAKGKGKTNPSFALKNYAFFSKSAVAPTSLITEKDLKQVAEQHDTEKQAFANMADLKTLEANKFKEVKSKAETVLTALKESLLEQLEQRKAAVLLEEIEKRKELERKRIEARRAEQQAKADEEGLDLSDIDPLHRNAFNELNKSIMVYARKLHALNDTRLEQEIKDGELLKKEDMKEVERILNEIVANLSKKEVKKWKRKPLEKNFAFRKVRFWLNETKAKEFFNNFIYS